jgi:hypothetical protein
MADAIASQQHLMMILRRIGAVIAATTTKVA